MDTCGARISDVSDVFVFRVYMLGTWDLALRCALSVGEAKFAFTMFFSDLARRRLLCALRCVRNAVGEPGLVSLECIEKVSVCETIESRRRSWTE